MPESPTGWPGPGDRPALSRRGLYFEEYVTGDTVVSQGRTITEADIVAFASLSGDWTSIHVDREYASQGMFGERVAHGLLGLSIASGLAARLGFMDETVIAFMGMEWKFKAPIRIGDTVRVSSVVGQVKAIRRLRGGVVALDVELINQRDEIVQRGTWSILVKGRPEGGLAPG